MNRRTLFNSSLKLVTFAIMLVMFCSQITYTDARKSYIVKEKIQKGELKVHSPRVRATDVQFCFFKDTNNQWCVDMDEDWTVSLNHAYTYDATVMTDGTPANYRGYQMYNSTQLASWSSVFNLARLYYSSLRLTLDEFSTGFRFEVFYWIDSYAYCLNFVQFSTPITLKILVDNRLEQCSKTLIDCFDDWTTWTSASADMLETCALSSSTEWALFEYQPWTNNMDTYYLGSALYNQALCFPGFSPFYSYHNQYPDNVLLQVIEMTQDLYAFATRLTVAQAGNLFSSFVNSGIQHNKMMMDGPIERQHSLEELAEMTKKEAIKSSPGIQFD